MWSGISCTEWLWHWELQKAYCHDDCSCGCEDGHCDDGVDGGLDENEEHPAEATTFCVEDALADFDAALFAPSAALPTAKPTAELLVESSTSPPSAATA